MTEPQKPKLSAEFLNAFIDGQLAAEEKSRAFIEIGQDEALGREACELRKLHELVQFAYADVVPPSRTHAPDRRHRLGLGLAAGVALAVGMVIGWVLHAPAPSPVLVKGSGEPAPVSPAAQQPATAGISRTDRVAKQLAAQLTPPPAPVVSAPAASEITPAQKPVTISSVTPATVDATDPLSDAPVKILVHISRGSTADHAQALNDIELLVRHYREQKVNARIEVVVNGEGLNLLRSDVTAHAERVNRLQQEYDNLTFSACQNTIDRLKREQGIRAQLLPGVIVIDSGVAQIMRRQHQGWAYIQV
jgi:intracellular sulfur oxidation DsrE/DsrF family protein